MIAGSVEHDFAIVLNGLASTVQLKMFAAKWLARSHERATATMRNR